MSALSVRAWSFLPAQLLGQAVDETCPPAPVLSKPVLCRVIDMWVPPRLGLTSAGLEVPSDGIQHRYKTRREGE